MLTVKSTSKPRENPKNEPTQAVCFAVVDMGQHEGLSYDKKSTVLKHKVLFMFELEQKRSDGLPFIMSQTYTLSLHKKSNLRKFLDDWNGEKMSDEVAKRGVDLMAYVGRNAYITPVINDGYANIGSVSKIRERDVPMVPTITKIPNWVYEQIEKAKVKPEGYRAPEQAQGDAGTELPF